MKYIEYYHKKLVWFFLYQLMCYHSRECVLKKTLLILASSVLFLNKTPWKVFSRVYLSSWNRTVRRKLELDSISKLQLQIWCKLFWKMCWGFLLGIIKNYSEIGGWLKEGGSLRNGSFQIVSSFFFQKSFHYYFITFFYLVNIHACCNQ